MKGLNGYGKTKETICLYTACMGTSTVFGWGKKSSKINKLCSYDQNSKQINLYQSLYFETLNQAFQFLCKYTFSGTIQLVRLVDKKANYKTLT